MGNFSLNILPNKQYGKLQKGFYIISTIFRLVGSSNLRFENCQIFKYILIFENLLEYFFTNIILINICDTRCQE